MSPAKARLSNTDAARATGAEGHTPLATSRSLGVRLLRIGTVAAAALVILLATFSTYAFRNNFAVVDDGRVFRSAQPQNAGEFRRLVADHRIASVLNLRGGGADDPWYRDEARVLPSLGVDFYDLPMLATERPSRRTLLRLAAVLDTCRYPLLIHCKSGSDRTGLAVSLYLLTHRGLPPSEALRGFSVWHGHVPFGGTERLQEPLKEYDAWLRSRRLAHSPERFRDWLRADYVADDAYVDEAPPRIGPRLPERPATVIW